MAFYRSCPTCGANLDPGEICDECRARGEKEEKATSNRAPIPPKISAMNHSNRHLKAAVGWDYN